MVRRAAIHVRAAAARQSERLELRTSRINFALLTLSLAMVILSGSAWGLRRDRADFALRFRIGERAAEVSMYSEYGWSVAVLSAPFMEPKSAKWDVRLFTPGEWSGGGSPIFVNVALGAAYAPSGPCVIRGAGFYYWFPSDTTWFSQMLTVPHWFAFAVSGVAALALAWSRSRLLRHDRVPGTCIECGYDLRATPDRCPECGTVSSTPTPSGPEAA